MLFDWSPTMCIHTSDRWYCIVHLIVGLLLFCLWLFPDWVNSAEFDV